MLLGIKKDDPPYESADRTTVKSHRKKRRRPRPGLAACGDLTRAARNSADVSRARMSFYKALYGEDEQRSGEARAGPSRTVQG
jgi:hypothetical protein